MRNRDWISLFVLVLTVAAVAGFLWFGDSDGGYGPPAVVAGGNSQGTALIGGPFQLTDQFGATVTENDLLGQWTLLYFGYTYCPDVCPLTLQNMTDAIDALGARGGRVVPMFVTVDPRRDTVEALREYAAHFHPRLRMLTGSEEDVAAAAKVYRVYRGIQPAEPGDSNYLVDHTSIVYVMGPDGKYATHFTHGTPVAEMIERLRRMV